MIRLDLDNSSKPVDENHRQLFHRINSPTFESRERASGLGRECGCRTPADFMQSGLADFLANFVVKGLSALVSIIPIVGQFIELANQIVEKITNRDFLEEAKKELAKLLAKETEEAMFGKLLRAVPAWVPVERRRTESGDEFTNKEKKEIEHEVEGVLTRSYQSCRDLPQFQWNHWYTWTFHVHPIKGYKYMYGRGNVRNKSELDMLGTGSGTKIFQEATFIYLQENDNLDRFQFTSSMECMMDIGAFTKPSGNIPGKANNPPGLMFHSNWPFWPMDNDYFWAAGRWVYDCTHADIDENDPDIELMPTQIHPCKAIAYSRYEGFKFDENEKFVPAVRFLFFACGRGGYQNFDGNDLPIKLNDKDYEFIVDLPEAPSFEGAWPIGHTPDFPVNTIVLRPRLLMKIDFAPFGIPRGNPIMPDDFTYARVDPIIEPVKSAPEVQIPDQVKITIPLTQIPSSASGYGVIISLGWFDADGTLAEKVRKVTLQWVNLTPKESEDEIRLKLCVNGRWRFAPLDVEEDEDVDLTGGDSRIVLHLPDDAQVDISAHGHELHGYGEFMEEETDSTRELFVGGILPLGTDLDQLIRDGVKTTEDIFGNVVDVEFLKDLREALGDDFFKERRKVDWKKDVDQPDSSIASAVAREMFVLPNSITNRQNDPLGMVNDKGVNVFDTFNIPEKSDLALEMKHLVDNLKRSGQGQFTARGEMITRRVDVIGNAAYLGADTSGGSVDYTLRCDVTIEDQ